MKVNSLTVVSAQESRIPATNHARDSVAPILGSCDRTSTDSLCLKCETENNWWHFYSQSDNTDDWKSLFLLPSCEQQHKPVRLEQ